MSDESEFEIQYNICIVILYHINFVMSEFIFVFGLILNENNCVGMQSPQGGDRSENMNNL